MRRLLASSSLFALLLMACGSGSMSAPEYFGALEVAATSYGEAVDEINALYAAAIDETIAEFAESGASVDDPDALGELAGRAANQTVVALGGTGIALEEYGAAVSDLNPPPGVEAAHTEFVASVAALVAAVGPTIDLLLGVTSVDDLGPAVAGSPFGDARPRMEQACTALQVVGGASGNPVDLRCGATGSGVANDG